MDAKLTSSFLGQINIIFLIQSTTALILSLQNRRIFPTPPPHHAISCPNSKCTARHRPKKLWHSHHLLIQPLFYTALYIHDLFTTDILFASTWIAVHHIIAILIFIAGNQNFDTATTLVPCVLHAAYWAAHEFAHQEASWALLALYNTSVGVVGLVFVINATLLNAWDDVFERQIRVGVVATRENGAAQRKSWRVDYLGVLAVGLAATNYYAYCWEYSGTACGPRKWHFWSAVVLFFGSLFFARLMALLVALEVCAPLHVLVGQRCGGGDEICRGLWCEYFEGVDWGNVRGYRALKRIALRGGFKEE